MIEQQVIGGRPATVAYLKGFEPGTPQDHDLVKIIFGDGDVMFARPRPAQPAPAQDQSPAYRHVGPPAADKGEWVETAHPRGQPKNKGEFAKKGQAAAGPAAAPKSRERGTTFVSPSTASHMNFAEAQQGLASWRQKQLADASAKLDRKLGIPGAKVGHVIGAWSDGAENSLMIDTPRLDPALARAAAAMKGHLADQKAVLVFQPDKGGNEVMANFEVKGDLTDLHEKLLQQGLAFHTLEPLPGGGARVHVYASDQDTIQAIQSAAQSFGSRVRFTQGQGEFIGTQLDTGTDDEQRADAKRAYEAVIGAAANSPGLAGRHILDVWENAQRDWRAAEATAAAGGQPAPATAAPVGPDLKPLPGSRGHPALISTRRPTAKGAVEGDMYRRADLDAMRLDPENFAHDMNLFRDAAGYPNLRPEQTASGDPEKIARAVIDHAKSNLKFLYENSPPHLRDQGHLWYEGANRIAQEQAQKYHLPLQSVVGVYAALSPQKLWDMNVYLGDRVIDIHQTQQNHSWDPEMDATAGKIWKPKDKPILDLVRGRSLGELDTPAKKALWIRTFDEAHSDRAFHAMSPDGTRGDFYRNLDGSRSRAAWQTLCGVANAVTALESGGDRDKISAAMGDRHKVRSFYNNILDPHSANEDVTMDTHAVGAALLRPLSGSSTAVMHSLGTNPPAGARPEGWVEGVSKNSRTGVNGMYALYGDAYREAAHELGVEPRVLQSITWGAKRSLFDNRLTDQASKSVEQAWRDYHDGKADLPTTQRNVIQLAGGFAKQGYPE